MQALGLKIVQLSWPLDAKSQLHRKDPDAGKDRGQEEKGQQGMRWLDGITDSKDMGLSRLREMVKHRESGVLQFMELQRVRHYPVAEQQQGIIEEELAPQILMLMSGAHTCQNGIKQKKHPVYTSA